MLRKSYINRSFIVNRGLSKNKQIRWKSRRSKAAKGICQEYMDGPCNMKIAGAGEETWRPKESLSFLTATLPAKASLRQMGNVS